MKREFKLTITTLVCIIAVLFSAEAAKKKSKTKTVCYKVSIHCENCKKEIEESIPFKKGVKDLTVNMSAKSVTVVFDPTKTDSLKIQKELEKLDFKIEKPDTKK